MKIRPVHHLSIYACLLSFLASTAQSDPLRILHTPEDFAFVQKQVTAGKEPWLSAYNDFILRADSALNHIPQAMANYAVPAYYGPDQAEHTRMKNILAVDVCFAYTAAIAYHIALGPHAQKKARYGAKAIGILNNWASINTVVSGGDGNLVMSYQGGKMPVAGELMYGSELWTPAQRGAFAGWTRNVYLKAADAIDLNGNNWGDWGTLGVLCASSFLGDTTRIKSMAVQVLSRVEKSIADDGHMPEETRRGDKGLWYSYFALGPMTEACHMIERAIGTAVFSIDKSSGRKLKQALDFVMYYSFHPDKWPYAEIEYDNLRSPDMWPGNMFEAMAEVYGDTAYEALAALGRPHYRNRGGLTWVLPTLFKGTFHRETVSTAPNTAPDGTVSNARAHTAVRYSRQAGIMPNGRTKSKARVQHSAHFINK